MQLGNTVHFNSFKWVKEELRQLLMDVQRRLEEYVNDQADTNKLDEIIVSLRQVRGTLSLVEIYGAALLSEEMEMVARALKNDEIANRESAFEVLLNASIKLPDYLDSLAAGNKDVPMVLLPLLNDLRACRNASLLSENVLFFPDVSVATGTYDGAAEAAQTEDKERGDPAELARKVRQAYQLGLLGWFRNDKVDDAYKRMHKVISRLRDACVGERSRRLLWVALAIIEALQKDGIDSSVALKSLMGKVDRQIKQLADRGEEEFEKELPDELTKNILYYVARSNPVSKLVRRVQTDFQLDKYLPDDADIASAEQRLGGPNQELLGRVATAIQEDVNQAKDAIEVYLHGDPNDFDQLQSILPVYAKIGDTLGMLGMGRARENVLMERSNIEAAVKQQQAPGEDAMMAVASVLLGVENELETYVSRRSDSFLNVTGAIEAQGQTPQAVAENQKVLGSLVNEALKNMAQVKDAFLTYINRPDESDALQPVPGILKELSGAMFIDPLDNARSLIDGLVTYFSDSLIKENRDPDEEEQDVFADVITNIECFLEAVAENRMDSELYIASAQEAVEKLKGYAGTAGRVRRPAGEQIQVLSDDQKTETELVDIDIGESLDELVIEDVDTPPPPPAPPPHVSRSRAPVLKDISELQIIGEDSDEDIIEVFIEEALEELQKMGSLFPAWRSDPGDRESLSTIRRSFHTLKGSGRLIGATLIGEFSWAMENMLNRLIDGTIGTSAALFNVIEEAITVLPQLIEQIRGNQQPVENVAELMQQAANIAAGDADGATVSPPPAAPRPADSGGDVTALRRDEKKKDESDELIIDSDLPAPDMLGDEPTVIDDGEDIRFELDELISSADGEEDEIILEDADATDSPEQVSTGSTTRIDLPEIDMTGANDRPPDQDEVQTAEYTEVPPPGYGTGSEKTGSAKTFDDGFDDDFGMQTDITLLGIFSDEAEHHLGEIKRLSEKARTESLSSKDVESLIRALHTLHGSARTAKFLSIAEKAKLLEHHANNLNDMGSQWAPEELDLLDETVTYIEGCISHLREHTSELRDHGGLEERLKECLDASEQELERVQSEKIDTTGYVEPMELDTELIEVFLEEAPELVNTVEHKLQEWKNNEYNPAPITEIMRQLHTLKGSARMASLADIGDLSHALESLFIAISSGKLPVSDGVVAMLTDAVDRLLGMIDVLMQGRIPSIPKEYIQGLEDVRLWKIEPEDTMALRLNEVQERLDNDDDKEAENETEKAALTPVAASDFAAPEFVAATPVEQVPAGAPQQEQIRVRADRLDALVNYAGEVNIYHSRLGQHIIDLGFNLGELEQTVARLHRQLRDMEIQTEAQIASRMAHEAENPYEEFDPLEMDRYSHMQQLSRSLSESASDLDSIRGILSDLVQNSEIVLQQQSRVSTDLQEELLQTRMVKFQGLASRLRRIVRQTALQLDKKVELNIVGADNEIDRSVQERMLAPLEHMLRNAVYHGIETTEQRVASGKPESGTIRLDIDRDGSYIVLNVSDDGSGIDVARIRRKALDMGLLEPDEEKGNQEIMQYILQDGFTTAENVSQIAGRGVGLDVVNNEIKQLGGSLTISSEPGRGTVFSVRLPLTLAINQALLVTLAEDIYAIPLAAIEGVALLSRQEVEENLTGKRKDFEYAGNSYDMYYLGTLLGMGLPSSLAIEGRFPLLLMRAGGRRIGVHMEAMLGRREIVVKPVGPQITAVPGISGATILADGRVALILDVAGLVGGTAAELTFEPEHTTLPFDKPDDQMTVMVVDDSITIRKVTARILSRHGLKVITAKDGLDAVQQCQEVTPDLFLMDIEMPRMDGFELASHVRADVRLQGIPIIMITSRTGEKHRDRAREIGVDRYLGKPFQEAELMQEINTLLDREATG